MDRTFGTFVRLAPSSRCCLKPSYSRWVTKTQQRGLLVTNDVDRPPEPVLPPILTARWLLKKSASMCSSSSSSSSSSSRGPRFRTSSSCWRFAYVCPTFLPELDNSDRALGRRPSSSLHWTSPSSPRPSQQLRPTSIPQLATPGSDPPSSLDRLRRHHGGAS